MENISKLNTQLICIIRFLKTQFSFCVKLIEAQQFHKLPVTH